MASVLQSVPTLPYCCCMPWHARHSEDEPVHGAACWFCDRAVAAPASARGKIVACVYCGLDRGFVPAVDVEPIETGWLGLRGCCTSAHGA
jgi:hypothetical protein